MCQQNLAKFENGRQSFGDVLDGDEVWFYWKQQEEKNNQARVGYKKARGLSGHNRQFGSKKALLFYL